jgi:hypothetical protein
MANIHEILNIDPDEKLLEQFKNITLALDSKRNQDVRKVLPHLVN